MNNKSSEKLTIWDIWSSITVDKIDISNYDDFESVYDQYLINKFMSLNAKTCSIGLMASQYTKKNCTNKIHYLFLMNVLDKEYIYLKHFKVKKEIPDDIFIKIGNYFNTNKKRTKEILEILSKQQIENICEIFGGVR